MAKTTSTKKTLLAIGIIILVGSSSLMALVLGVKIKPVAGYPVRVACIGDSITEGSGYPGNLQTLLGTSYLVSNFGVSGSAAFSGSPRPYMNQSAFQRAKAYQPSIVVIMLGTNDAKESAHESAEDFSGDYRKLVSEYQSLESSPKVWLVKPPPIFDNSYDLNNTDLEEAVIPSIERVADEFNLPTINVNRALINSPQYFFDGVHPNPFGALLIAQEISQALASNEAIAGP